jgi:putative flippase GtrA
MYRRMLELIRAGLAGIAATAVDLATLTAMVSLFGASPRVASIPALLAGGTVNFIGNRHYAFRAVDGPVAKQALGYTAVELIALALNGLLYDAVLRAVPSAAHVYWLVRLVTTNAVFLLWSFPLWRRVFATQSAPQGT